MSLTKTDLQQIEKIVDRVVDEKLEKKLEEKLEEKFNEKLSAYPTRVEMNERFEELKATIPDKNRIYNTLDAILYEVKGRVVELDDRLTKIEKIHIKELSMAV